MSFIETLNTVLDEKHLLKHEFYQAWTCGELTIDYLRIYAQQYFHHVNAFPRYVSATHANCESLEARQLLLENLIDEEQGSENHPELWLRFAEGIGETRENVKNANLLPETRHLIDTFLRLAKSSYAQGIGALYAYERQIPSVADSKIAGLKKFYNIVSDEVLKFFTVHLIADIHHANATRQLLNELSEEDKEKAADAANEIANALWNFLTGVQSKINERKALH
ncbi:MAG: putative oxidoreductase CT_610 [Legionellaceae bacterium]